MEIGNYQSNTKVDFYTLKENYPELAEQIEQSSQHEIYESPVNWDEVDTEIKKWFPEEMVKENKNNEKIEHIWLTK